MYQANRTRVSRFKFLLFGEAVPLTEEFTSERVPQTMHLTLTSAEEFELDAFCPIYIKLNESRPYLNSLSCPALSFFSLSLSFSSEMKVSLDRKQRAEHLEKPNKTPLSLFDIKHLCGTHNF